MRGEAKVLIGGLVAVVLLLVLVASCATSGAQAPGINLDVDYKKPGHSKTYKDKHRKPAYKAPSKPRSYKRK